MLFTSVRFVTKVKDWSIYICDLVNNRCGEIKYNNIYLCCEHSSRSQICVWVNDVQSWATDVLTYAIGFLWDCLSETVVFVTGRFRDIYSCMESGLYVLDL